MKAGSLDGVGTPEAVWLKDGRLQAAPACTARQLVPAGSRCVVIAPHPDDEVLPCAGLLQELARLRTPLCVVAVTDGEGSHRPGSLWTPERLRSERPIETQRALRELELSNVQIIRLQLPDAAVRVEALRERLPVFLRPGDVLLTTWGGDSHPDHVATSLAVQSCARPLGLPVLEMPIWGWHWATPGEVFWPWERLVRFPLGAAAAARKQRAIGQFQSQLADDPDTGQSAILPPPVLARFQRAWETFFLP